MRLKSCMLMCSLFMASLASASNFASELVDNVGDGEKGGTKQGGRTKARKVKNAHDKLHRLTKDQQQM